MPRHRDVPSLQSLALKGIGCLVVKMAPCILTKISIHKEPPRVSSSLQKSLIWLNKLLSSHVPYYLYDQMAVEVLKSVEVLIEETKKTYSPHSSLSAIQTELNVAASLTEVVLNNYLKSIDFSQWPNRMIFILYKNLHNLTGLEEIIISRPCLVGWSITEFDKSLLNSISVMKNLKSLRLFFDSSDVIVQTISDNCVNIQCLDLSASGAVTDRCIKYLLKCKNLKELYLHRTSVTTEGLSEIIANLPKLQDIGRCDDLGNVVKHLHRNYPHKGPFALKKIQTRDISTENLRLLVEIFPKIEYVSLLNVEISDLTVLISLNNLKDLKLLSCAFYGDYLIQLLEIRGNNLTSLHLEHVEDLDFKVLVDISQFCPQLKELVCYNCDFRDIFVPNEKFKIPPFLSLETIHWDVEGAIKNLEFILNHAYNIRFIHLGSSTDITHSSIMNVLSVNPMKKLEEFIVLYSHDMNMRSVELLLASCTNLKVLSQLENWQGITMEELEIFQKYIVNQNFDLDLSSRI